MITPDLLRSSFEAGLPYDRYVATGSPDQQANWARTHTRVALTPDQQRVVRGFSRRLPVLVTSGMWCGDCAQQCPIFDHIARLGTAVDLRFVDRDVHKPLADAVRICGGNRVPTVLFLNEDFEFVALAGDKSLSRLRHAATTQLGSACPVPGAAEPADLLAATVQDWVNDFERAHLIVRLSAKLRQRHGD